MIDLPPEVVKSEASPGTDVALALFKNALPQKAFV